MKIKNTKRKYNSYDYIDKLHVITDIPHKKSKQKFFNNIYKVIVNHNIYMIKDVMLIYLMKMILTFIRENYHMTLFCIFK